MDALMNDGDLSKSDIAMKFLSFGVDGMNVFQVRFSIFTVFVFIGFCCCWILYLNFVWFFKFYTTH